MTTEIIKSLCKHHWCLVEGLTRMIANNKIRFFICSECGKTKEVYERKE